MPLFAADSVGGCSAEEPAVIQALAASSGNDLGEFRRNKGAAAFGAASRLV